jgi:hypothetical protein
MNERGHDEVAQLRPSGADETVPRARARLHNETYAEAHRRVLEHPYFALRQQSDALLAVLDDIFEPNARELLELLQRAASDLNFAMELVQNVRPPIVGDEFRANVHQRLHNYLAATFSLVEHTQAIMSRRERTVDPSDDSLRLAWDEQKQSRLTSPAMTFMKDLRRYIQHYSVVPFGHTVSVDRPNTATSSFSSEVMLDVAALLEWRGWTARSRAFLDSCDAVELRALVIEYREAIVVLNQWFYNELVRESSPLLDEFNELVAASNAALAGISIEEARVRTAARTAQLSYDRPGIREQPPEDGA